MNYIDLPERWKQKIAEWIQRNDGLEHRVHFCSSDFPYSPQINLYFEDGSMAAFNYAILIEDKEHDEIGIFTEHCGHHIFSKHGTAYAFVER